MEIEFYEIETPNEITAYFIIDRKDYFTIGTENKKDGNFIFIYGANKLPAGFNPKRAMKKMSKEHFIKIHLPKVAMFKEFIEGKLK